MYNAPTESTHVVVRMCLGCHALAIANNEQCNNLVIKYMFDLFRGIQFFKQTNKLIDLSSSFS